MASRIPAPIPTLHVADIELPRELQRLYELAYNLWWTWTPAARDLFSAIDGARWGRYQNPVQLLINIEPKRWYPLLENETFLSRYHGVLRAFDRYLLDRATWFRRHHQGKVSGPIAYFSMEYGIHQSLAIYSGGLGVLSGDHCKSASDLGLPFVAVGLLYRHGYFQQTIDSEGWQQHTYPHYDFTRLPLRPVVGATGRELRVAVPLPGRDVAARVWLAQIGRVPLLLLDTDVPENDVADRPITYQLYVQGREMRLLQEIVLGVGGVKALRAVGIDPAVWHLNEGHCVFLQLERWRELVAEGRLPEEARSTIARDAVFTTHTPVEAGNERFEPTLVDKYFGGWCDAARVPLAELLELGRAHAGDELFNLTALAIKTTRWVNGVSRLNANVTSEMWRHLLPDPPPGETPVRAVTNGVHARTWLGRDLQDLLGRHLGDWQSLLLDPGRWQAVLDIPDDELWAAHEAQKERLGRFLRARLREQVARHGAAPDELRQISALFDPDALTIGFARRFATYKRARLIFMDEDRLARLFADAERPVQMIFAGKAHPADRPGQELIQRIFELGQGRFQGHVFFIENYDMGMGARLVQGVDVWLNTPRRPLEASGTSGQKAAMNGVLNCSIADGWWPEGFDGENGWVIGDDRRHDDENEQDLADVQALYALLEGEIVPTFFDRDQADLPRRWLRRMKASIAGLTPRFSASRMVGEYVERGYLPAGEGEPT